MPTGKRGTYRLVTVNLDEHEAGEADRLTDVLKRAGWPNANRSLIMREALVLLEQDLAGKDDEGVFRYFVERYARRLGPARSPQSASPSNRSEPTTTAGDRTPRNLLDVAERKY